MRTFIRASAFILIFCVSGVLSLFAQNSSNSNPNPPATAPAKQPQAQTPPTKNAQAKPAAARTKQTEQLPPDLTRDEHGFLISKPNPYNTPNMGAPGSTSNNLFGQPPGSNPNTPTNAPSTPGSTSNNLFGQPSDNNSTTSTNSPSTPGSFTNNLSVKQPGTTTSTAASTTSKTSATSTTRPHAGSTTSAAHSGAVTTSTPSSTSSDSSMTVVRSGSNSHGVDLNTASADEINAIFGANLGTLVIKGRPYKSVTELSSRGLVPQNVFDQARNKVTVH